MRGFAAGIKQIKVIYKTGFAAMLLGGFLLFFSPTAALATTNYTVTDISPDYAWTTLVSPTEITYWTDYYLEQNNDNGVSADADYAPVTIPIPFTFNFYGSPVSEFYVGTNGYITFDTIWGSEPISTQIIPTTDIPNSLIAGALQDLDLTFGGTVKYETFGTTPDRVMVIEFNQVPHLGDVDPVSFQIKLFEGSDKIEIHTETTNANYGTGDPTNLNEYMLTQGTENSDGSVADYLASSGRNRDYNLYYGLDAVRFEWGGGGSAPVANNDTYDVARNDTLTVAAPGILTNDTYTLGGAFTITKLTDPANGTLDAFSTSDGSFTFTPTVDWWGTTDFTYKITDDNGTSGTATVSIHVGSAVALDTDTYPVQRNIDLSATEFSTPPRLLGYSSGGAGTIVSINKLTDPSNGDISAYSTSDGSFIYSPDPDYVGADSFTFQVVNDLGELSRIATATFDVTNTAPVANLDSYSLNMNGSVSVSAPGVMGNDTDANGDTLSATKVTDPSNGVLDSFDADGSFLYTPTPGYAGADSFTYKVSDGLVFSNTVTVTLYVIGGTQAGVRWRNDDGDETAATWYAAQDLIADDLNVDDIKRLRFSLANSGTDSELLGESYLTPDADEKALTGAVLDQANNIAYFGSWTIPAKIIKVALNSGASAPTRVDALTLNVGEGNLVGAAIDTQRGYAYFASSVVPGKIIKIRLSDFTRVSDLSLAAGEDTRHMAIDQTNGYLYVVANRPLGGGNYDPGEIVKIAVGAGDAAPTRIGTAVLDAGEGFIGVMVADPANGYVYAALDSGKVVKVTMGSGSDAPSRLNSVVAPWWHVLGGTIDTAAGFAYFARPGGFITKIALGSGTDAPTIVGSISTIDRSLVAAALDATNGYAYFGSFDVYTDAGAAQLVKIKLSDFSMVDTTTLIKNNTVAGTGMSSALIDPVRGYAYFNVAFYDTPVRPPDKIFKVSIAPKYDLRLEIGTKVTTCAAIGTWAQVPTSGTAQAFHLYDTANFSSDGSASTNSGGLSDPSGKTFQSGQLKETSAQTSDISLGEKQFTEVEYALQATSSAVSGNQYCFRLTNAGSPMSSYTNYAVAGMSGGANSAPVAVGDSYSVSKNGALTVAAPGVLTNDTDADFDPLTAIKVTDPAHGTLGSFGADGSFTYTPYTGYVGADAFTYHANDGTDNSNDATVDITVTSNDPTIRNTVALTRLKAGESTVVTLSFDLQNTLTGTVTVSFPVGFTVSTAFTGGTCSTDGSVDTFAVNTGLRQLSAAKHACAGTLTLTGATITNPVTPGAYYISWVNDDPGGATVYITAEDQVNVQASVEPIMSFNVGSQPSGTACAGTFADSGGTVALGELDTASVRSSDASSIYHICARVTTNGTLGAAVTVKSANSGLKSASTPGDVIGSASATLTAGVQGYGLCAGSTAGDWGKDSTTPAGVDPSYASPFNGSCSTSGHAVGGLSGSLQSLWTLSTSTQNAFVRLYVKAAISGTTPAHNDYTDTLTFVASGTY